MLQQPANQQRLTFADRTAKLLELAKVNVAKNLADAAGDFLSNERFVELEWGADLPVGVVAGGYSLVVCAELLYEVAAVEPLLSTLSALLAPDGVAVFGHRDRNGTHKACLDGAAAHGLEWTELSWRPWEESAREAGKRTGAIRTAD